MIVILFALAGVFLVAYLIRRRARLNWLRGTQTSTNQMLNLIFKSTALAMGSISVVAAIVRAISTEAHVVLLSFGLLALALSALQNSESPPAPAMAAWARCVGEHPNFPTLRFQ